MSIFGIIHRAQTDNRKGLHHVSNPISNNLHTVRFESQLGTCIPDRNCSRFTSFSPQSKSQNPQNKPQLFPTLTVYSYILPFDAILCTTTLSLHKLTPWDSVFRETNFISVNNFSAFYGTKSSLPCSQQPATCL